MKRRREIPDPLRILGLGPAASLDEIEAARRALAKRAHPDVGGSLDEMQRINAAADAARRTLGRPASATPTPPPPRPAPPTPAPPTPAPGPMPPRGPIFSRYDNPSFTIEALPAAAFEALLIVGGTLGDVIDDDPPYRLEVALSPPIAGWCRLDLLPEAGASSIALTVGGEPGAPPPDLDLVRDAWIAELNQLDWDRL
jgi:hypothetical protein